VIRPYARWIHPDRGGTPAYQRFFTSFIDYRPSIWDMQWHRGQVLAADMVGGFYSIRYTGKSEIPRNDPPQTVAPPAVKPKPTRRLTRNRLSGGRLRLRVVGTGLRSVKAVTFRINGRRVAIDRRRPFRVTVKLGKLARRKIRLSAGLTLAGGKRVTLRRTLHSRLS
jgi:hypothetical protein